MPDSSLKEDILKIQEEINKLNNKFEKEINQICETKKNPDRKTNEQKIQKEQKEPKESKEQKELKELKEPKEKKKRKKLFKNYFIPNSESQKKFLNNPITPKVLIHELK